MPRSSKPNRHDSETNINSLNFIYMEQLEDFIIQEHLKEGVLNNIDKQEEGVNRAIQALQSEGLPTDIDTLRRIIISDDAFNKWVSKAEASYIGKLGFVPKEELKRIKATFRAMADRTAGDRNTIATFLNDNKYPIVQDEDGTLHYDREEVDKALTAQFTKRFTDEDKEYFQVLQEAKAGLIKLFRWEQEHQYVPLTYSAINVGRFLREGFTKDWFCNYLGVKIGKMNPKAIEMLEEQSEED